MSRRIEVVLLDCRPKKPQHSLTPQSRIMLNIKIFCLQNVRDYHINTLLAQHHVPVSGDVAVFEGY